LLFQLVPLELGTAEIECGLLPTLKSSESGPDFARSTRVTSSGRKPGGDDLVTVLVKALLPTLTAGSADHEVACSSKGKALIAKLKLLPTLAARDYRSPNSAASQDRRKIGREKAGQQLPNALGGIINPSWAEWFMGYPAGWTELEVSETRSTRRSRRASLKPSRRKKK
jgi:hypothetical protein